ncbi:MAG TPA: FtsQ-type POTRA domain-containing protein [Candidatus Cybelea sp.]
MSYARARRTKRSPASRVRPFWVLLALAGIAVAGALGFFATWPGFDLAHVTVSGNRKVTTSEILLAARISVNRSIWLENTGAIAARIGRIPYVESASIHRLPPASLAIVVRERVPIAILQVDDDTAVVDRSLRVLEEPASAQTLPVFSLSTTLTLTPGEFVTSKDALELRDAYETLSGKGTKVTALSLDRYGDLTAELPGGVRLLLGAPENLEKKIALAGAIISQTGRGQRKISALDLRAPNTPVIVYR